MYKKFIFIMILLQCALFGYSQYRGISPLHPANKNLSPGVISDTLVCIAGSKKNMLVSKEDENRFSRITNSTTKNLISINKTDDKTIFVTGNKTLIRTTDAGIHWAVRSVPELEDLRSAQFINSTTGFVLTGAGILKTTDAGATWNKCPGPNQSYYDVYDLFMVNESLGFAIGGGTSSGQTIWSRILKTTDGENWTNENSLSSVRINKVYFKNNSNGYMLVSGDVHHICSSTDAGNNWSCKVLDIKYGLSDIFFADEKTGYILGYTYSPNKGNIIYKTVDGGINWNKVYEKTNNDIFLSFYFSDSINGYAVGELGNIATTIDGGKNWIPLERFTDNRLNSVLLTNAHSGYIIGNNGTFVSFGDIPVGISKPKLNLPTTIACYPNPFNETIQFEIISNSKDQISIELFDLNGRIVDKVIRTITPGKQTLQLTPPNDIKKGMYIYKIKGKEINTVGKISKGEM